MYILIIGEPKNAVAMSNMIRAAARNAGVRLREGSVMTTTIANAGKAYGVRGEEAFLPIITSQDKEGLMCAAIAMRDKNNGHGLPEVDCSDMEDPKKIADRAIKMLLFHRKVKFLCQYNAEEGMIKRNGNRYVYNDRPEGPHRELSLDQIAALAAFDGAPSLFSQVFNGFVSSADSKAITGFLNARDIGEEIYQKIAHGVGDMTHPVEMKQAVVGIKRPRGR